MTRRGFGVFILIVLAVISFLWLIKAPILSSYISKKMGVMVSARSITVLPSHMKIRMFRVHNPKGFKSRTALSADEISLSYLWGELVGDPNVIDEIVINDVNLNVEVTDGIGKVTNWSAILDKMPARSGKSNHFIIKKLIVNNLKIEISGLGVRGATQTKTIARMEFDNVDSEQGFPTQELITKIFGDAGLMQFIEHAIPGGGILKVLPFGFQKKEAGDFSPASRFEGYTIEIESVS